MADQFVEREVELCADLSKDSGQLDARAKRAAVGHRDVMLTSSL